MKTYLIVTNDEYEQPVAEIVGSKEAAEFLGLQRHTLSKYMTNGFPKCHEFKAVVIKDMLYETEEKKIERQRYKQKKWRMEHDINEYDRNRARQMRKMQAENKIKMDVAIKHIADKYGYDAQSRQLIEECAELIQAVNKVWRIQQINGRTVSQDIDLSFAKEHLIEGLADVSIMVEQMLYLLDCKSDFEAERAKKIKRQLGRMAETGNLWLKKQ